VSADERALPRRTNPSRPSNPNSPIHPTLNPEEVFGRCGVVTVPRSFATALLASRCASADVRSAAGAEDGETAEWLASECCAGAATALPLESFVEVGFCAPTGRRPMSAAQAMTSRKLRSLDFMATLGPSCFDATGSNYASILSTL